MKRLLTSTLVGSALVAAIAAGVARPASAQTYYAPPPVPVYNSWQASWDRYEYDRHHVILGTVAGFQPYRLMIARRDGYQQQIDLKNGTIILPTGATPTPGQRVAVVGYYSNGTFIANRLVLRY